MWHLFLPRQVRGWLGPRIATAMGRPSPNGRELQDPPGAGIATRSASRFPRVAQSVSVVIPTLNAGARFARTLAVLQEQRGIGDMEIVVVDSGSTDDTCTIAEAAQARLLHIAPGDFNHGATRNLAAEAAAGDVLLMTVQDAVLLSPTGVRDLVLDLYRHPRIAAVSARQVARSDADLFAAFGTLAHHRAIWPNRRTRAEPPPSSNGARAEASDPSRVTALERRAAAAMDDVCAAIRHEAWSEIRFAEVDFAEDLEFGLRAVEDGWTIGLSSSVAVAHSHRRDATYHLRRSVADRLHVAPMIDDDRRSRVAGDEVSAVVSAGRGFLSEIQGGLSRDGEEGGPRDLVAEFDGLENHLRGAPPRQTPLGQLAELDELLRAYGEQSPEREAVTAGLREEMLDVLTWRSLSEFVRANRAATHAEGLDFATKLTGAVVGRALGDSIRTPGLDEAAARRLISGV
jgi:glycosyltransferase involved in cell wall biosynthesis